MKKYEVITDQQTSRLNSRMNELASRGYEFKSLNIMADYLYVVVMEKYLESDEKGIKDTNFYKKIKVKFKKPI